MSEWKELTIKEAKEITQKRVEEMTDEECITLMDEMLNDGDKLKPNEIPSPFGIAMRKMVLKYKEMCDYEKELKLTYGEKANLKNFIPYAMQKCY